MTLDNIDYGVANSRNNGTGNLDEIEHDNIIFYPFNKYVVKIKLTKDDKFIEILEIKLNKQFYDHLKNITPSYHDVDDYYKK